jgi:glucose/arabinose dehydrogenase
MGLYLKQNNFRNSEKEDPMKHNIKYYLGIICISLSMINATIPPTENISKQSNFTNMAATVLNPAKITFQEVVSGLDDPVFVTHAGDGSERLFIVEQRSGKIRIVKNGVLLPTPFLNIQSSIKSNGGEQGLLSVAFHPLYATNGKFFVFYTAPSSDSAGSNLILEKFSVSSSDPDLADMTIGSHEVLLTIPHPGHSNHNGGTLAFGQDGYLYWSIGDGGGPGDPNNNGQNREKYLGKILRLDVDAVSPYIPASNPFFSTTNPNIKKEIWAYGLRNPWRFSFDRLTHDLYIGDVGQSVWEEVNFQLAGSAGGENYGWRVMEANRCNNPDSGCNTTGKVRPVAQYSHGDGRCSVTGGYVYRGVNFPSLYGHYLYGDFCTGRLFTLYRNSTGGWDPVKSVDTPYSISTFGEDEQGELYLADYATGKIYNIGYQEPGPQLITPEQESFINNQLPTFEWQAISSADHYEIVIASDQGFTSIIDSQDDVIGASFIPNVSLLEGKYYWHVRGINSLSVAGAWSETRSFTVDITPFSPPTPSSPADGTTVTLTRPTFRWSAEQTAINYQIEVDNDPGFSSPELTSTTKRKTLYQGPALPNGTYYWHVQVMDKAGNWSGWSSTFVITINH